MRPALLHYIAWRYVVINSLGNARHTYMPLLFIQLAARLPTTKWMNVALSLWRNSAVTEVSGARSQSCDHHLNQVTNLIHKFTFNI